MFVLEYLVPSPALYRGDKSSVLPTMRVPRFCEGPGTSTAGTGATFCGNPIDINPDPSSNVCGPDYASHDKPPPGENPTLSRCGHRFDHTSVHTPTMAHPYLEVKYKEF